MNLVRNRPYLKIFWLLLVLVTSAEACKKNTEIEKIAQAALTDTVKKVTPPTSQYTSGHNACH